MSDYNNQPNRLSSGNGIYYFIGGVVLLVAIVGGVVVYGPPRQELANAPDRSRDMTLPIPATPLAPTLPAAPGTAPVAPRE